LEGDLPSPGGTYGIPKLFFRKAYCGKYGMGTASKSGVIVGSLLIPMNYTPPRTVWILKQQLKHLFIRVSIGGTYL